MSKRTPPQAILASVEENFQTVKQLLVNGPSVKTFNGNPKEIASRVQRSAEFKLAQQMKQLSNLESMAGAFEGELKNAVKFAQQVNAPEQFAKSFAMAQGLLDTAKKGLNILANMSVGGIGNILQSINFASHFQQSTKKQNEANAKDPYEEFLKALYREVTKLEPLDQNEKPTPEYKLWKALYLLALELGVSEEFLDACRATVKLKKFNLLFLQQFDVRALIGT